MPATQLWPRGVATVRRLSGRASPAPWLGNLPASQLRQLVRARARDHPSPASGSSRSSRRWGASSLAFRLVAYERLSANSGTALNENDEVWATDTSDLFAMSFSRPPTISPMTLAESLIDALISFSPVWTT